MEIPDSFYILLSTSCLFNIILENFSIISGSIKYNLKQLESNKLIFIL